MTHTNLSVPTVVLVHAAWADASSWGKIIPPLQRRGLQAVAVQIPLRLSNPPGRLRRHHPLFCIRHLVRKKAPRCHAKITAGETGLNRFCVPDRSKITQ
jgi:hypothetical protein